MNYILGTFTSLPPSPVWSSVNPAGDRFASNLFLLARYRLRSWKQFQVYSQCPKDAYQRPSTFWVLNINAPWNNLWIVLLLSSTLWERKKNLRHREIKWSAKVTQQYKPQQKDLNVESLITAALGIALTRGEMATCMVSENFRNIKACHPTPRQANPVFVEDSVKQRIISTQTQSFQPDPLSSAWFPQLKMNALCRLSHWLSHPSGAGRSHMKAVSHLWLLENL